MSQSPNDDQKHSQPISIDHYNSQPHSPNRRRSASLWSNPGLSTSPTSPISPTTMSALQTPNSFSSTFPRPTQSSPTATSPLSYFLPGSPVKTGFWANGIPGAGGGGGGAAILPGKRNDSSAIVEDEEMSAQPRLGHNRAASVNWNSGTAGHERAAGVMRRLSLGGASLTSTKPNATDKRVVRTPSPPSAPAQAQHPQQVPVKDNGTVLLSPSPHPAGRRGTKRSDPIKKRGVSPMGERMLKGHFDGFGL